MEEDYDLVRIMFDTINDLVKSHGCDCLLTAKWVDIDLLSEKQINWMKEIISKWETANK
jgi:hypothetical protein